MTNKQWSDFSRKREASPRYALLFLTVPNNSHMHHNHFTAVTGSGLKKKKICKKLFYCTVFYCILQFFAFYSVWSCFCWVAAWHHNDGSRVSCCCVTLVERRVNARTTETESHPDAETMAQPCHPGLRRVMTGRWSDHTKREKNMTERWKRSFFADNLWSQLAFLMTASFFTREASKMADSANPTLFIFFTIISQSCWLGAWKDFFAWHFAHSPLEKEEEAVEKSTLTSSARSFHSVRCQNG